MSDKTLSIRPLKAWEVEAKPQTIKETGAVFSLYKTARADMNVLDEAFGLRNWQAEYERREGILYCTIKIWDQDKKEWISKTDVGFNDANRNEIKVKGELSDAFKRAGVVVGIGRELYTAPFIWVKSGDIEIKPNGKGGYLTYDKIAVKEIEVAEDHRITKLELVNERNGKTVFNYVAKSYGNPVTQNLQSKVAVNQQQISRNATPARQNDPKTDTAQNPNPAKQAEPNPTPVQPTKIQSTPVQAKATPVQTTPSEPTMPQPAEQTGTTDPGSFVINMGNMDKGKTLRQWYSEKKANVKKPDGTPDVDKIFQFYTEQLRSPNYVDLKNAAVAYKAAILAGKE